MFHTKFLLPPSLRKCATEGNSVGLITPKLQNPSVYFSFFLV